MKITRAFLSALALLALLAVPAFAQDDENCADFSSQEEAQAHLNADSTDPDNLDADADGVACENFDYANGDTDGDTDDQDTQDDQQDTQDDDQDDQQGEVPDEMPENGAGGMAPPPSSVGTALAGASVLVAAAYAGLRRR